MKVPTSVASSSCFPLNLERKGECCSFIDSITVYCWKEWRRAVSRSLHIVRHTSHNTPAAIPCGLLATSAPISHFRLQVSRVIIGSVQIALRYPRLSCHPLAHTTHISSSLQAHSPSQLSMEQQKCAAAVSQHSSTQSYNCTHDVCDQCRSYVTHE